MSEIIVRLDLRSARRAVRGTLAAALVFAAAADLGSESVSLTTYYPAPSGVYAKMITTGATYLARDGGNVDIGTGAALLTLNGQLKITGGSPGTGKVLTSDSAGKASWGSLPAKQALYLCPLSNDLTCSSTHVQSYCAGALSTSPTCQNYSRCNDGRMADCGGSCEWRTVNCTFVGYMVQ